MVAGKQLVKSGWKAGKITSCVMKRCWEEIPAGGRSVGSHPEPQSSQEAKATAWLGSAAACTLGQRTPALVMHKGKRERSRGHDHGPPSKVRKKMWLCKTKTDLQNLASSQAHPELTLLYHHGIHWGGLLGTR